MQFDICSTKNFAATDLYVQSVNTKVNVVCYVSEGSNWSISHVLSLQFSTC
jgi:hypothetical protein